MSGHETLSVPELTDGMPARRARISLTPLIDVVFILLVFFMLASSFTDWRVITLNPPAAVGASSGMENVLLVELQGDGLIINGSALSRDEAVRRIEQLRSRRPEISVLLRPSGETDVQAVVAAIDILSPAADGRLSILRGQRP